MNRPEESPSEARRARMTLALAWLLLVLAPDLHVRATSLAHGPFTPLVLYAFSAILGFSALVALTRLLGELHRRSKAAATSLVVVVAVLLAVLVTMEVGYEQQFFTEMPPSAFGFALANPGYSWALFRQSLTARDLAMMVLGVAVWTPVLLYAVRRARALAPMRLAWVALPLGLATAFLAFSGASPSVPDLHAARVITRGTLSWWEARKLTHTTRRLPIKPVAAEGAPLDVILIVHESLGAEQLAPWNPSKTGEGADALSAFFARHEEDLVTFTRAKAVSNATDVALPTLLTGIAPDSIGESFFTAPLAWQEADALGYESALVSSQFYDWANFHEFFLAASAPDVVKVAETFPGAPESNDHGIDDRLVVDEAIRLIEGDPKRPLFLVLQLNSTHWPCWAPGLAPASELFSGSKIIAPSVRSLDHARCDPAARFVAGLTARVLEALERTGRIDRALVLGTSDHGETFRADRPSRIDSFYDDVLTVPLFVHLPPVFTKTHPEALARLHENKDRLVSNLDLYPTILDAWGRFPPSQEPVRPALAGSSLMRPIPADRALFSVNTFELRSWSREGFAVFHGRFKWIVDEVGGTRLFDVSADPGEASSLAERAPADEASFFRALLAAHAHLDRIACKSKSAFCVAP